MKGRLRITSGALILLGGLCASAEARPQDAPCLDRAREAGPDAEDEIPFDLRFDRTDEDLSFSCDLEIRASEARDALAAFRYGVLYSSESHIEESVEFPLSAYVWESGTVDSRVEIIEIRTPSEFLEFKDAHFDEAHVALIACANTFNVDIVKSGVHGFNIGFGLVWFRPWLHSIPVKVTDITVLGPIREDVFARACAGVALNAQE